MDDREKDNIGLFEMLVVFLIIDIVFCFFISNGIEMESNRVEKWNAVFKKYCS